MCVRVCVREMHSILVNLKYKKQTIAMRPKTLHNKRLVIVKEIPFVCVVILILILCSSCFPTPLLSVVVAHMVSVMQGCDWLMNFLVFVCELHTSCYWLISEVYWSIMLLSFDFCF